MHGVIEGKEAERQQERGRKRVISTEVKPFCTDLKAK